MVNYLGSAAAASASASEFITISSSAIAVQADIFNVEEIKTPFDKAKANYQRIDIFVSNSGIEHDGALLDAKPENFDKVFNIPAASFLWLSRYTSTFPMEFVWSSCRLSQPTTPFANIPSMCAVEAFARCFSQDFGARRITVNSITPGGVKMDIAADVGYKYYPMTDSSWQIEGVRIADPIDIARVVSFLASDDAGWLNGQNITISGGASG